MQPAQAPVEVQSAFDNVLKAREDREHLQNDAQSYANKVVPVTKGKAQRILDEARGYQEKWCLRPRVMSPVLTSYYRCTNKLLRFLKAGFIIEPCR